MASYNTSLIYGTTLLSNNFMYGPNFQAIDIFFNMQASNPLVSGLKQVRPLSQDVLRLIDSIRPHITAHSNSIPHLVTILEFF